MATVCEKREAPTTQRRSSLDGTSVGCFTITTPLIVVTPPNGHAVSRFGPYPLQASQTVRFSRDGDCTVALWSDASRILALRGLGYDSAAALQDLDRQFEKLVDEKVRRAEDEDPADDQVRDALDAVIDWRRYQQEHQLPQLLWGRIAAGAKDRCPTIYWRVGPDGAHEEEQRLPERLSSPYFRNLPEGQWFRAVVRERPGRIEWLEVPTLVPEPTPEEAQKAWDDIPRAFADEPGVWPLRIDSPLRP